MSPAASEMTATRASRSRLRRRILILGTAVLLIAAVAIFGPGTLAWWARQMALRRLSVGALSAAEQWLARSARFDPSGWQTDLMLATCYRQRYEQELWNEALQSAERRGAPAELIRRERQLGRIQAGIMDEAEDELSALVASGVPASDVFAAFVHGYLARQDAPRAQMVLDAWAADQPGQAHVAYMRGAYRQWLAVGEADLTRRHECFVQAETEYQNALAREPRHEPARQALAELLEDQDRLDEAAAQYAAMAAHSPASESAKLDRGRLLRALGSLREARAVLASLGPRLQASALARDEIGQLELEWGNYEEAQK